MLSDPNIRIVAVTQGLSTGPDALRHGSDLQTVGRRSIAKPSTHSAQFRIEDLNYSWLSLRTSVEKLLNSP